MICVTVVAQPNAECGDTQAGQPGLQEAIEIVGQTQVIQPNHSEGATEFRGSSHI